MVTPAFKKIINVFLWKRVSYFAFKTIDNKGLNKVISYYYCCTKPIYMSWGLVYAYVLQLTFPLAIIHFFHSTGQDIFFLQKFASFVLIWYGDYLAKFSKTNSKFSILQCVYFLQSLLNRDTKCPTTWTTS